MFWDNIASLYDLFENVYNGKVYKALGQTVAAFVEPTDRVLECACGTGAITLQVAASCEQIVATDFSDGMLKQARKKCRKLGNVVFEKANIMALDYETASFDKVVAGNVIHLLDEPQKAMEELMRVCKPGGQVILPCYVNTEKNGKTSLAARFLETLGLNFKRQFDYESYQAFFTNMGHEHASFTLVEGRMPCAIAVITNLSSPPL